VPSDIEVFVEYHIGPNPSNQDQLCSQLATDHLVSCYHFLIFCTIVLSNMHFCCFWQNQYGQEIVKCMEGRSIGEWQTLTWWPCTLAEGERAMDDEPLVPF
jgi:hypothetical protein